MGTSNDENPDDENSSNFIGDILNAAFGSEYLDKTKNEPDTDEALSHVLELHDQKMQEARLLKKLWEEYHELDGRYEATEDLLDDSRDDVEYLTDLLLEIRKETDVAISEFDEEDRLDIEQHSRKKALELREEGLSIKEIQEELPDSPYSESGRWSKSTICTWVKEGNTGGDNE